MKLLVLDGNSIVNRAFYGIKLLTTKSGQYTNAIFGFLNILLKLEESEKPDEIAIAFDLKAPTFRHKIYKEYKGTRKGMPAELASQMPILRELLEDLGYKTVSLEGYEADDILGTLASVCAARGDDCLLATGDRDSLQLVHPHVSVLLTTTRFGKGETQLMDEAAIFEKYGVTPAQFLDVKALMGDASDNIPGVPGVGEKTAYALIQKYKSLENVYASLNDPEMKPAVKKRLEDGEDNAILSHKLAEIHCEVPIETATGSYLKQSKNDKKVAATLSELEMFSILDRLQISAAPPAPQADMPEIEQITAQNLDTELADKKVFLAPKDGLWYIASDSGKVYTAQKNDEFFLSLLENPSIEKQVFDSKELYKSALQNERKAQNISFDATLAAYLINPSGSDYSPTRLVQEYIVHPLFSVPEFPEIGALKPLFTALLQEIEAKEMHKLLQDIEQPLALVLASMELIGIRLDVAGIKEYGKVLQQEIEKEVAAIHEISGVEFNINSPKQLGEVLFDQMKLPHGKKTKTGWSTNAETLESLREHTPLIDHVLLYRSYAKLNSTYVEGLLKAVDPDGRVRSTFNQTEARTGRISSNEPNMQNIPIRTELGSQLRRFFLADPGMVFADADYSQIELRILAHISGDEAMKEAFSSGQDIHRTTAAKVNGLPPEMVTPGMRSAAKAVNFGIVYGIGAFSLSKDIGISVKDAKNFIQSYLDNFPGVKNYMDDIVQEGRENEYVSTLYGRRRPLPELANSNFNVRALGERMALNTPIQGTAADVIKLAMIKVYNRLEKENLHARLILQVHDELIVETPIDEVDKVKDILQQEMQNAAQLSVPLVADVSIGSNWLEAKE